MFTIDEKTESFVASGDLSACLGRVVQPHIGANFVVELATADKGFGVLANAPKDTEHASVVTEGITMVRVGAAVSAGDRLCSTTSGWAITATQAAAHFVFALARTNAASGMLAAAEVIDGFVTVQSGA